MSKSELVESLAGGPHALLARLVGDWKGKCRTWFEPGKLADTQSIRGKIRATLGGRFIVHRYKSRLMGERMQGHTLIGHDLSRGKFIASWADTCHNGTTIMNQVQDRDAVPDGFSLLGGYPDGRGGPDWGWRTEFTLEGPDKLSIRHYNIPPQNPEALAVEINYSRA